jgi:transcriptional regulator with XRE-family HTH domain
MSVKFVRTRDGEMAVVPRAEYERLKNLAEEATEDAGTARLVARAKREIANGAPLLPKEIADRLAEGENPIRVLREFRQITQAELVAAVGISQGYLSDLETGKRKGPMELHQKFARALGMPLDLLAPISVSAAEADPSRYAKRRRAVTEMKQHRSRLRGRR